MRFTRDGADIRRDQWRREKGVGELQFFLDDKYCLVISLVFLSSFEQIVVFAHGTCSELHAVLYSVSISDLNPRRDLMPAVAISSPSQ